MNSNASNLIRPITTNEDADKQVKNIATEESIKDMKENFPLTESPACRTLRYISLNWIFSKKLQTGHYNKIENLGPLFFLEVMKRLLHHLQSTGESDALA